MTLNITKEVTNVAIDIHMHDPIVTLDSLKCRTCGEQVDSAEEVISRVQSSSQARRIQDEIAMAGGYAVTHLGDDGVTYSKTANNIIMDIFIRNVKSKVFEVVKLYRRLDA